MANDHHTDDCPRSSKKVGPVEIEIDNPACTCGLLEKRRAEREQDKKFIEFMKNSPFGPFTRFIDYPMTMEPMRKLSKEDREKFDKMVSELKEFMKKHDIKIFTTRAKEPTR